jgi:hypothetical protein
MMDGVHPDFYHFFFFLFLFFLYAFFFLWEEGSWLALAKT